jgi:cation transport regulator ChaC
MLAWRRQRHPELSTPPALHLSRLSLVGVFAVYLTATLACALVITAAGQLIARPRMNFTRALRDGFAAVLDPGGILLRDGQSGPYYVVVAIASIVASILPVMLLGAFVYKLFRADPLVWRRTLSVEDGPDGRAIATVRFYNRTRTPLVDMTIRVFARVRSTGSPSVITNIRLPVLVGGKDLDAGFWAYSETAVPFTVRMPLGRALDAQAVIRGPEVEINGKTYEKFRVEFAALASGTVLETGNAFVSIVRFRADEMTLGHFQDIDVDYETAPQTWRGWPNFDGNSDLFIFGYASLIDKSSLERTLDRPLADRDGPFLAELAGHRRDWNVGSDRRSHPERRLVDRDGGEFTGTLIYLGLVPDTAACCIGAVLRVSHKDLSRLDLRERNYTRIDVTADVTWVGKPKGCTVYTYTPSDTAMKRCETAIDAGRAAIRAGYAQLVEKTFQELGAEAERSYRESTPDYPCPVQDIEFVYPARPSEVPNGDV